LYVDSPGGSTGAVTRHVSSDQITCLELGACAGEREMVGQGT